MMSRADPDFNVNRLFNTLDDKLEAPAKNLLKKVYMCVTLCILSATAGVFLHISTTPLGGTHWIILPAVGAFVVLIVTPDIRRIRIIRFILMLEFAFLSGILLGPILNIYPKLILEALLASLIIFICLGFSAHFAKKRLCHYTSGFSIILGSGLVTLLFTSLLLGFGFIFQEILFVCLILTWPIFFIYHTHRTIERSYLGDEDFIWHSASIFLDLIRLCCDIWISLIVKLFSMNIRNEIYIKRSCFPRITEKNKSAVGEVKSGVESKDLGSTGEDHDDVSKGKEKATIGETAQPNVGEDNGDDLEAGNKATFKQKESDWEPKCPENDVAFSDDIRTEKCSTLKEMNTTTETTSKERKEKTPEPDVPRTKRRGFVKSTLIKGVKLYDSEGVYTYVPYEDFNKYEDLDK